MGLTKQQLEALNVSSFPDNTSELITPQILRDYNSASIVNTVNQDTYTTDSASFSSRINAITSSGNIDTASFATTGSNNFIGNQTITGSVSISSSAGVDLIITGGVEVTDGSGNKAQIEGNISRFPQLYAGWFFPQNIYSDNGNDINVILQSGLGVNGGVFRVNAVSGSQFTGSINVAGNVDITGQFLVNGVPISGSTASGFATTGSNTFVGNQTITGSVLVTQSDTASFTSLGIENKKGTRLSTTQNANTNNSGFTTWVYGATGSPTQSVYDILVDSNSGYTSFNISTPFQVNNQVNFNGALIVNSVGGVSLQNPSSSFSGSVEGIGNVSAFSASVDSRINGIVTGTGFATTGSNTFTGDQSLRSYFDKSLN